MKRLIGRLALCSWFVAMAVCPLYGGTGVGNHFVHCEEKSFDFHVAYPPNWKFDAASSSNSSCNSSELGKRSDSTKIWRIDNTPVVTDPSRASSLQVSFILDFPANDNAELKRQLQVLHPNISWQPVPGEEFIGWTSGEQAAGSGTEALTYYLIDRMQVIKIAWHKDEHAGGAADLQLILNTVNRVSRGPDVLSIFTERATVYQVGETACFFIEMDDLKGDFGDGSIRVLNLVGTGEHWSFKDIEWVGEKNWFKTCFKVSVAFGENDLNITRLEVETQSGREIECESETVGKLSCGNKTLTPVVARVNNPHPDKDSPIFSDLRYLEGTSKIQFNISDESGVYIGKAKIMNSTLGASYRAVLYSDHLSSGEFDLKNFVQPGWNLIETIVVFDTHGWPTLLQIPEEECGGKKREKKRVATYQMINWRGECSDSGFPVINFLAK